MKQEPSVKKIKIDQIKVNESPQIRVTNNSGTITEYSEHWTIGGTFPPIVVFGEKGSYWLGDGFYRVESGRAAGKDVINAEIRPGGLKDALIFALSANATHGLPRTRDDRRNAVKVALGEYPQKSNNHIAELCAVGDGLVKQVRQEVADAVRAALAKYPGYDDHRIAEVCQVSDNLVSALRPEIEAELKRAASTGDVKDAKPEPAKKVIGKDGKLHPANRKSPGIPAVERKPTGGRAQESVVLDTANGADPSTSFEGIAEAIRKVAVKLESSQKDRLIQDLRSLADELESGKGQVVTAE
jgi:hypothetical protein